MNANTIDIESAERRYWAQDEFLVLDDLVPADDVRAMTAEANALRARINRNYVPGQKKGGSVSFFDVRRSAPRTFALYESPVLRELLNRITRETLLPCRDTDPHSCALYFYTEEGDHIGYHYDTSFYRGKRYTVLIGLVERSSSRLVCQLHKGDASRPPEEVRIATEPGRLVLFNGDKLWHCVTPLGAGEERIVLTLQYVTDQRMGWFGRIVSEVKDAVAYFGLGGLVRRGR